MALNVTKVGGNYELLAEGQYDMTLIEIRDEGTNAEFEKPQPRISFWWAVEGEKEADGSPKKYPEFMNANWGGTQKLTKLRERVYAMTGGKLNKFVDAVISLNPGIIDLEWFVGTQMLVQISHQAKYMQPSQTVAAITGFMAERKNADELKASFLSRVLGVDKDVYQRAAAIAGLPLNGVVKAPVAVTAVAESDDEDLPF